jgi:hypothetical protein
MRGLVRLGSPAANEQASVEIINAITASNTESFFDFILIFSSGYKKLGDNHFELVVTCCHQQMDYTVG